MERSRDLSSPSLDREAIGALLDFWFGSSSDGWGVAPERMSLWFEKRDETDAALREHFGALAARAHAGDLAGWAAEPRGALALILLLDQLPRNLHRGTPASFASDPQALALARAMIATGQVRLLRPIERVFVYLPLEHAEDLALQEACVALFRELAEEAPPAARPAYETFLDYAERHRAIIARFGRFPHRNAILGRPSTPAEAAFLREPNSSF